MGFCRDDSALGLLGQKAPVKAEKKRQGRKYRAEQTEEGLRHFNLLLRSGKLKFKQKISRLLYGLI